MQHIKVIHWYWWGRDTYKMISKINLKCYVINSLSKMRNPIWPPYRYTKSINSLIFTLRWIVCGLNMSTVHPHPHIPHSLLYFCSLGSPELEKKIVNRKNIGINFMLTPQMTFCVYCAPNLRGYGWYMLHYISVDCLITNSYIPRNK